MKCSNLYLPILALVIWACSGQQSPPNEKENEITPSVSIPQTLAENLEAHGYDTWKTTICQVDKGHTPYIYMEL